MITNLDAKNFYNVGFRVYTSIFPKILAFSAIFSVALSFPKLILSLSGTLGEVASEKKTNQYLGDPRSNKMTEKCKFDLFWPKHITIFFLLMFQYLKRDRRGRNQ